MTEVLVYAPQSRADVARAVLRAASQATGASIRLELYGTGSLYRRLGPRHGPPPPDVVFWFGPFAARAAALDGLLQPYRPARLADGAVRDPDWKWITLDFSIIGSLGSPSLGTWADAASAPRLALADPERSEVGMSILLASLDRARQIEGDAEQGWAWWRRRAELSLVLAEDDSQAPAALEDGSATHVLTLSGGSAPLSGLAPIPHAIGLANSSRNVDAARALVDWLTSQDAAGSLGLSPWQAGANGLDGLLKAAPPLDVEWARQQYSATRQRWAQSGFGPRLRS